MRLYREVGVRNLRHKTPFFRGAQILTNVIKGDLAWRLLPSSLTPCLHRSIQCDALDVVVDAPPGGLPVSSVAVSKVGSGPPPV
jgi:hypothetical protein